MRYMMLIHHGATPTPPSAEWDALADSEKQAIGEAYGKIVQTPGVTAGLRMASAETATTVRVRDGETLVTDGPFAEIKEAVGGYFFFEADDLDAAIALAAQVPAAHRGGAVEVRPLWE